MKWKRFLLVQLPAALVVSAALAEGAAWALGGVAPRRHDLDRLAAALEAARVDAPVVLMGDSITQDVAKSYRLAEPGRVANLTTNMASGAIGAALLLRRYLERNAPPQVVVIAATGDFFAYAPEGKAAETWLSSVFRRPDERAELARFGLAGDQSWRPAALAVETRLGERLAGLVAPAAESMPAGTLPPGGVAVETDAPPANVAAEIADRVARPPVMSPSARWAVEEICRLSERHGFWLAVWRAPQPDRVTEAQGAALAELDADIVRTAGRCRGVELADFNRGRSFPDNAFRDAHHLRRPGWTARYGALLAETLADIPLSQTKASQP